MIHRTALTALAFLLLAIVAAPGEAKPEGAPQPEAAAKAETDARAAAENWVRGLKFQKGRINLGDGLATLNVPEEFKYLGPADSSKLLRLFGNPPQETLGILFPADTDLLSGRDRWFVVMQFSDDGHVKDDDAASINYGDLLQQMQKGAVAANEERTKAGYPSIEIVGWAAPPRYDRATHKLYWAKELSFGGEKEHTLNYNIRMLGRRGVLVANAVAGMDRLGQIEAATPQILAMVDFNEGHRYADFKEGTDKVATYGIAGLIAAGVAAKAGFFKVLGLFLLKGWKLVALAVAGVGAWVKRLAGRREPPAA